MSETKWINEAIQGDRNAFGSLYGLYKDRLYRYAYYRLGDREDAMDAVADCALSAWKQIGALRIPEAFSSWIFSILHGCCATIIKNTIRQRDTQQRLGRDLHQDPAATELSIDLQEALSHLKPQEAEIVLLAAVGGLKSNEIADIVSLTPGGVRTKLARSLAKMRADLMQENHG